MQAARGGVPSGQGYHPSPLARSFDSTHAPSPAHFMYNVQDAGSVPPPGFAAPQYDNFQVSCSLLAGSERDPTCELV